MPIYEYKCDRCSGYFEMKQSFDAKPYAVCHICGGEARRIFKPVPIVFKGSGFYVTDHSASKESAIGPTKSGRSKKDSEGEAGKSSAEEKSAVSKSEKEGVSTS